MRSAPPYPHADVKISVLAAVDDPNFCQIIRSPLRTLSAHASPPHTRSMSKHVKDATRFTATGVWAHTRPGGRATTLQFADPAPKNETPQQKVKRLREAANRAKMAQVTKWDYAYLYGRMAADAAHRFTVYGLIFATGMSNHSQNPFVAAMGRDWDKTCY